MGAIRPLTTEQRVNQIEAVICKEFRLSPETYLELWHETGCRFAEMAFKDSGLVGKVLRESVTRYITSPVYWDYWADQWVKTCEWFLHWDYSKKTIDDLIEMQLQAPRPQPKLHSKIIEHGNTSNRQSTLAKTA